MRAIHTHSAPSLSFDADGGHPNNVAYTRFLLDRILETVDLAMKNMEPVRLAAGSGASPVGVNRRAAYTPCPPYWNCRASRRAHGKRLRIIRRLRWL
jgi:hypothetical protein